MRKILLLFSMFILTAPLMAQVQEDDILGKWLTADEKAIVEITKNGSKFFGKIVWLKEPNEEDGTAKLDDENPDVKLQNQPIMGLTILKNFVFDDDDEWEDGKIYEPPTGKTYSCYMKLIDPDKLKIRGFIGFSLIGATEYWTRK